MHLVLLCGLSGAGKSTAVRALEDIGYYCIDHLPVTVLMSTLRALAASGLEKIAIGVELHDNEFMRQQHFVGISSRNRRTRLSCWC